MNRYLKPEQEKRGGTVIERKSDSEANRRGEMDRRMRGEKKESVRQALGLVWPPLQYFMSVKLRGVFHGFLAT